MKDVLELDQEDFFGRLLADPRLSDVAVLLQRKGVTESDVESALSVFNDRGTGKLGAAVIVLMPSLTPQSPNLPSAEYDVRITVQVIEMPLVNLGDTGSGISAEQLAQRVRQLFQVFSNGYGSSFTFAGMEPIAVSAGQISYGVSFTRLAGDPFDGKVATPAIEGDSDDAPATVTITCGTAGAAIYYTTDGSYPSSQNTAATLYTVPFAQADATTIRASAEKADLLSSNIVQLSLS